MKLKLPLQVLSLFAMYIMLTSAAFVKKTAPETANTNIVTATASVKSSGAKAHKLNFFQRLVVKLYMKKKRMMDSLKADKLAKTSLILGIGACGLLLLGIVIGAPVLFYLTLPAGIAAMITGGAANRQNTALPGKARTGKALGLGALIAFGVLLIIGAILIASLLGG